MYNPEQAELIQALNADEFRESLESQHPDRYQLIDVRAHDDYVAGHLAGALAVPVADLPQRVVPLDREKPTMVYCHQGALCRAAAKVLARAGFEQVYYLTNGFDSWQYGVSSGSPEEACEKLLNLDSAVEQAELAWQIEEAARFFYLEMSKSIEDPAIASLFAELVVAEEQHKATLKALWEALAGRPADNDFPGGSSCDDQVMEGGLSLEEALDRAKKSRPAQIIDYAMAMELNAYDHYLYLQRNSADPDSQRLFEVMADEERHHLKELARSLDKLNRQA